MPGVDVFMRYAAHSHLSCTGKGYNLRWSKGAGEGVNRKDEVR